MKIDWEGVDSEGKPYEPTWEVAAPTTLEGEAWRAFVSQKRRLSGNKNWSVADIPFKRNARPGKGIARCSADAQGLVADVPHTLVPAADSARFEPVCLDKD